MDEDNSGFYSEILQYASEGARILLVPFAKDPERVPAAVEKVTAEFTKNMSQRSIRFELANESSFAEQVAHSDVLYLHGGTTVKLLGALQQFPDFKGWCQGKVVAGESAGANVLVEYFYSPKSDVIGQGLGVLPVKISPHYTEASAGKMNHVGEGLEFLPLPEYEFRTYVLE